MFVSACANLIAISEESVFLRKKINLHSKGLLNAEYTDGGQGAFL